MPTRNQPRYTANNKQGKTCAFFYKRLILIKLEILLFIWGIENIRIFLSKMSCYSDSASFQQVTEGRILFTKFDQTF